LVVTLRLRAIVDVVVGCWFGLTHLYVTVVIYVGWLHLLVTLRLHTRWFWLVVRCTVTIVPGWLPLWLRCYVCTSLRYVLQFPRLRLVTFTTLTPHTLIPRLRTHTLRLLPDDVYVVVRLQFIYGCYGCYGTRIAGWLRCCTLRCIHVVYRLPTFTFGCYVCCGYVTTHEFAGPHLIPGYIFPHGCCCVWFRSPFDSWLPHGHWTGGG